ncbi:ubiquitin-2 like Rad60 SUMO-like-domain-containing protein [Aspergillus stella-maris]|uniref:ubiquitin-2 like Rad60 SUMO-like-domain-containing protein n=1 Tax=Aspergillus stella-maris TaxID=1810926 RepID=UPI003CCCC637
MPSYFNKPSWATRGVENEDTEFYRRAEQTYKDIVATNINARQRREDSTRKNTPHKRQRLSDSTKDGYATKPNVEQVTYTRSPTGMESSPAPQDRNLSPDRPSTFHQVSQDTQGPPATNSHDLTPVTSEASHKGALADSKSFSPSHFVNDEAVDAHVKSQLDDANAIADRGASRSEGHTAQDNTVVQILITSQIPASKSLIVHRKMSQSLKGVRLAWCERQGLPKELASTVFLTWKGKRLFDVTTCRSLNIETQGSFTKELSLFDDHFSNPDGYRVHMEAVTEEMLAAGRGLSLGTAEVVPTSITSAHSETEPQTQHEITLKCPELDDFKICVSSATRASQVVGAFCKSRCISSNSTVYLAFDGDRLDPDSCLSDYGITDGDMIEAIVRKGP